jgi:MFS family permease
MALSRSNRAARKRPLPVALYSLCLPPLFLAWQSAFDVSFTELGLAVALMPGASAILQTPVGFVVDRYGARRFLIGGALRWGWITYRAAGSACRWLAWPLRRPPWRWGATGRREGWLAGPERHGLHRIPPLTLWTFAYPCRPALSGLRRNGSSIWRNMVSTSLMPL